MSIFLVDMVFSSSKRRMRVRELTAAIELRSEPERGGGRRIGRRDERFEVTASIAGGRNRPAIDDFLARELRFANRKPDGGMTPEDRSHGLFAEHPEPVTPGHMVELVCHDRALVRVRRLTQRCPAPEWTDDARRR